MRKHYEDNRERLKEYRREYYRVNAVKLRAQAARLRAEGGPAALRAKTYGVSPAEQQAIFEAQGGLCPICFCALSIESANLDHCHTTGAIRAFTCGPCNRGMGQLNDDPVRLRQAAIYLEKYL